MTVRPFRQKDVSAFIRIWYRFAYSTGAFAEESGKLIESLQKHERIKRLAINPLLCTIIAIVYRKNRILPDRRATLYCNFCEALVDIWEKSKYIQPSSLIGGLAWETKLDLLSDLAYWMHSKTERLQANEEEIILYLRDALKSNFKGLAESGKEELEARNFVEFTRDRSGLLQGRGDGSLEFSHWTFQEYLTARYLATMDEESVIDGVMPHLHQAWWEEVHLLLFGILGTDTEGRLKIERLIFSMLDSSPKQPLPFLMPPRDFSAAEFYPADWFPSWQLQRRISPLLGRDLAFAVRAYCECTPEARTESLTARLQHEIELSLSRWRRAPIDERRL